MCRALCGAICVHGLTTALCVCISNVIWQWRSWVLLWLIPVLRAREPWAVSWFFYISAPHIMKNIPCASAGANDSLLNLTEVNIYVLSMLCHTKPIHLCICQLGDWCCSNPPYSISPGTTQGESTPGKETSLWGPGLRNVYPNRGSCFYAK